MWGRVGGKGRGNRKSSEGPWNCPGLQISEIIRAENNALLVLWYRRPQTAGISFARYISSFLCWKVAQEKILGYPPGNAKLFPPNKKSLDACWNIEEEIRPGYRRSWIFMELQLGIEPEKRLAYKFAIQRRNIDRPRHAEGGVWVAKRRPDQMQRAGSGEGEGETEEKTHKTKK